MHDTFWRLGGALFFGAFLLGCDRMAKAPTSVVIQMPSVEQLQKMQKSDVSAMALVNLQKICFAVNVKGAGITVITPAASCDIERGTFAGSVGPGGTLSVDVEIGTDRVFELYAFLRANATDACPTGLEKGWNNWPLNRVYFLGKSDVKEIKTDNPPVEIPFSIPNESQNIVTQKSWSLSCLPSLPGTPSAKKMGRVVTSATVLESSTTHFKAYSKISPLNDEKTLGTNYKIKNWKVSQ